MGYFAERRCIPFASRICCDKSVDPTEFDFDEPYVTDVPTRTEENCEAKNSDYKDDSEPDFDSGMLARDGEIGESAEIGSEVAREDAEVSQTPEIERTESIDSRTDDYIEAEKTPEINDDGDNERVDDEPKKERIEIMENTRLNILIDKSRNCYDGIVKIIGDLYDAVTKDGKTISYTKERFFAEYDVYLQSALVSICSGLNRFGEEEMEFIESLSTYGKLVDGTDFTLFANCSKEMRDKLAEMANEKLAVVPYCVKVAGALDSTKNFGITKAIHDLSVKICFNLKLIDENADIKSNTDILNSLKAIHTFAALRGIKLR